MSRVEEGGCKGRTPSLLYLFPSHTHTLSLFYHFSFTLFFIIYFLFLILLLHTLSLFSSPSFRSKHDIFISFFFFCSFYCIPSTPSLSLLLYFHFSSFHLLFSLGHVLFLSFLISSFSPLLVCIFPSLLLPQHTTNLYFVRFFLPPFFLFLF